MEHVALYRAWRPQSFQDMVGQQHIIRTLQNAIREQRLSHAYLFSGPRGTGKTSAAKILAKAVNCEKGPTAEPCNECDACRRITAGAVMDVLEIDAASNRGVEEIRDLREKVKYAPTEVRQKVYIIDEVHMLTTEAFNALLKTLEEPPPHVMFILATTEPHRLPATVISRCQRFDFRRVSLEEQSERLKLICEKEGINAEDEAIQYIARLSDGGMRDALSILDQIASFSGGQVSYRQVLEMTGGIASRQFAELAQTLLAGDVGGMLQMIDGFMQEGKSADKCMENLLYYFRDLLMVKMVPQADKLTERVLDPRDFAEIAESFSKSQLFKIIDTLNHYQTEMKYAVQPQTLFEVALLKICTIPKEDAGGTSAGARGSAADASEVGQLRRQLSELEAKLERALQGGLPAGAGGGGASGAAAGNRPAARSSAPRVASKAKIPSNLDRYIAERHSPAFMEVQNKWNQILQAVKEEKVTIHAWFMNGEPVSVLEDSVLVAFKNDIHRETTEKPANKQLIENVMARQLGSSCRLVTMMLKDWNDAIQGAAEPPKEAFELEPPPEDGGSSNSKEPWVDEALNLFGDDLVVIKE
ncbi:MAG: DNA polymerase III subunit gamma/tau [Paenibacillus macerans]|uniref:DNA-directed DNA polymerase n=2 Tax=Paenibacillus macerans TaxID=44252 RepID=A0A6N8F2V2_PAEMA|nr:DNA polymerase III subunit gamma/tau [Paenibacillus macerans]MBS5913763.1 DNA polymerase III subunit gamma/tau [Paenibacillus macerans]MCY7557202.1 DNA polymerase III subunit gamma/tau [Paenibacillus macerans]MDU7475766.1 DNA polymerase III subunit gamma/tau [Paenibacillus macerans]MEC0135300.1 DNA polymerase III subunit gamma/tau [Paenibacillus macerans]MEC0153690.1 DNA polymerase III subunit gamma/tau [Paenibacillus macerans]